MFTTSLCLEVRKRTALMGLTLWEDTARTTLNQGLHAGAADKHVKSRKGTNRKASHSETSEQKPEESTELCRRQNGSPGPGDHM